MVMDGMITAKTDVLLQNSTRMCKAPDNLGQEPSVHVFLRCRTAPHKEYSTCSLLSLQAISQSHVGLQQT